MKTEQKQQFYCEWAEVNYRGRMLDLTQIWPPQNQQLSPKPHLGRGLQTVLRLSARRVIGEQGEPGEPGLPHADPLGQSVQELLHRGGTVETHHLGETAEDS